MVNRMKKFEEYKEEIYSCSRCGLCQGICPLYKTTGLETVVSRGQFSLLNGILNGNMAFNKKVYKNLDMCLHCDACKSYCPSDIDAEKIITSAKIECYKYAPLSKKLKLFLLNSNIFLKTAGRCVDIARFLGLHNLLSVFHFGSVIKRFLEENVRYKKLKPARQLGLKVFYFPGCVNTYFNKSILNSMRMLAEKNGFELIIPEGLRCCSVAHLSAGDFETFYRNAVLNLDMIPDDVDYVVFDCAAYHKAFELYYDVLNSKKTKILKNKLIHLNNFIDEQEVYVPSEVKFDKTVSEHIPCHLKDKESIWKAVKKMGFVDNFEKDETHLCCGAAGLFCFEHGKLSKEISKKKAAKLEENADIVLTSCSSCTLGILQGLSKRGDNIKIYNPVELLAEQYIKEENLPK